MRRQSATAHELARAAELAGLSGEVLARLGEAMERRELGAGADVDATGQFAVVLTGMLAGATGMLRPGDIFDSPAKAIMPAAVAVCDLDAVRAVLPLERRDGTSLVAVLVDEPAGSAAGAATR